MNPNMPIKLSPSLDVILILIWREAKLSFAQVAVRSLVI